MTKRLTAILFLAILGLSLAGCTRCGWFWEDGARSCQAQLPR
jgi:hypothetical protein